MPATKSTFKRNLLVGFGFSMVLLIVSSVASYTSIQSLLRSANLVEHTNQVIEQLENTISVMKDAETGQRGFLLTGKTEFLTPYTGAKEKALASLQQVKELTLDNPEQQKRQLQLYQAVIGRFEKLESLIGQRKLNTLISVEDLEEGRKHMDQIRTITAEMKISEQVLMKQRTEKMNQFANTTPILILVASVLSLLITIVFFARLNNDYQNRLALQIELIEKDKDITRRIGLIKDIADKVSSGDYAIRVQDEGQDGLGNLSYSLNKMAGALQYSFGMLADKEWLQTGIATLNNKMLGEREIKPLANAITEFVVNYTGSAVGAFYISNGGAGLVLAGSFAFSESEKRERVALGEGLVGQCASSRQLLFLKNVPEENISISFAAGEIKPKEIVAIPIVFENNIMGVLELASLDVFTANELAFIDIVSSNIGIVLNTSQNRVRLQELLEETQQQSEELQAQHAELENMNVELEIKTEKLQASEEELRVQQEELMQANQELEEKAVSLEEKNQLISERNFDIQKKAEELALSTKYKSEFLANMSHELRTPLNSILLLSRLMAENLENTSSPEHIEYANVIQSSGQGLLTLINEILDLSKIESGKMELEYGAVTIASIVADAKATFQPMANEKQIAFETEVDPTLPASIESDNTRLGQIIKNLLSNALKFTSKGFIKLAIKRPANHPGFIDFTVTDSGIGIAKEKIELVFEAFRQADGSTRRKYGGTGLGLSITRELVKLLGGEIRVESELDKGSSFTISLPIEKPDPDQSATDSFGLPQPIAIEFKNEPAKASTKPAVTRFLSEKIPENIPDDRDSILPNDKVIVIVEDDINFAKSLLDYTRSQGYKGVVAVRGDEGIELVNQFLPSGVLLDIQLPIKDGWEVMDDLKSNTRTRHIPVHIMSSYEVRNKSLSQGAIDFINKPVGPEKIQEIFQKIEYIIEHHPKKVLIIEENTKHAKALAYFLESFNVNTEIRHSINEGISALEKEDANCVILDMGIPGSQSYDTLEQVKQTPGLENLPIIIFTGKSLSKTEEMRIRQYADSIVVKTAHSYRRILDEVSLFLHLMEENKQPQEKTQRRLGGMNDVLQSKTVLVADDDVRNIFSITKALENFKMTILPAIDGKEALQQLDKQKPDVILMDMMMPEMDGYETIKRIRSYPKYKNLPIIAVTAKAMSGDREKCIAAGASDYITKPVDIDQLLSLLRVWLYETS
jgi:signal transduction histidine kinase/DNA-binding response OmpR family regulator/CHASE3 domain sensor protein